MSFALAAPRYAPLVKTSVAWRQGGHASQLGRLSAPRGTPPTKRLFKARGQDGSMRWFYQVQADDTPLSLTEFFQVPITQIQALLPLNPQAPRRKGRIGNIIALRVGDVLEVPPYWVEKERRRRIPMRLRRKLIVARAVGARRSIRLKNSLGEGEEGGDDWGDWSDWGIGGDDNSDSGDDNSDGSDGSDGSDNADDYSYLLNIPEVSSLLGAADAGADPGEFANSLSAGQASSLLAVCGVMAIGLTLIAGPFGAAFAAAVCAILAKKKSDQNEEKEKGGGGLPECKPGFHIEAGECIFDKAMQGVGTPDKDGLYDAYYGWYGETIKCSQAGYKFSAEKQACVKPKASGTSGGTPGGTVTPGGGQPNRKDNNDKGKGTPTTGDKGKTGDEKAMQPAAAATPWYKNKKVQIGAVILLGLLGLGVGVYFTMAGGSKKKAGG